MRRCRADVLGRQYSVSGPARSREALLAAGPSAARCADAAELEEGHTATQVRISDAAVGPHDALQRFNLLCLPQSVRCFTMRSLKCPESELD